MRRAAEHFEALTHLPLSKSSLHALLGEVGTRLVQQEEAEAEALNAGVETSPPAPDAETMAVSLDGVMVHLREEGWKEAKVAAFSAVRAEAGAEGAEPTVHLERHSYRAGLWEAPAFAKQQWAEAWRRGLEQAARVVAVSDGAAWIWNIVRNCYAPCVEILDWWHALQKLWLIAWAVYGEGDGGGGDLGGHAQGAVVGGGDAGPGARTAPALAAGAGVAGGATPGAGLPVAPPPAHALRALSGGGQPRGEWGGGVRLQGGGAGARLPGGDALEPPASAGAIGLALCPPQRPLGYYLGRADCRQSRLNLWTHPFCTCLLTSYSTLGDTIVTLSPPRAPVHRATPIPPTPAQFTNRVVDG
ncbi:MAG: hypothetical protein ACYC5M_18220 [Anaerolineae bacterium]